MKTGAELYRQNRLLTDDWRALEAEVFRRVAFVLRQNRETGGVGLAKAIADARVLWMTVHDLVSDDGNHLPTELRQSIARLARTLLAEMDKPMALVDVEILALTTIRVAEGLESKSPPGV